jgi:hypothetical protein
VINCLPSLPSYTAAYRCIYVHFLLYLHTSHLAVNAFISKATEQSLWNISFINFASRLGCTPFLTVGEQFVLHILACCICIFSYFLNYCSTGPMKVGVLCCWTNSCDLQIMACCKGSSHYVYVSRMISGMLLKCHYQNILMTGHPVPHH